LIHCKIIELIDTEFIGKRRLFNTLEIKETVLNALKKKSELNDDFEYNGFDIHYKKMDFTRKYTKNCDDCYNYYYLRHDDNWRIWDTKENKDQKIKRIIHLLQRMSDIVNMKSIDCIIKKRIMILEEDNNWIARFVDTYVIEPKRLHTKCHDYYIKVVTKFVNLMVSIMKNQPNTKNKNKK
jgi:hypothetical protein